MFEEYQFSKKSYGEKKFLGNFVNTQPSSSQIEQKKNIWPLELLKDIMGF